MLFTGYWVRVFFKERAGSKRNCQRTECLILQKENTYFRRKFNRKISAILCFIFSTLSLNNLKTQYVAKIISNDQSYLLILKLLFQGLTTYVIQYWN